MTNPHVARRIAMLVAISAFALASAACGDQNASPTATPPPDPLSPPAAETAIATPISPPRIDAAPLVEVTGLFTDPRPTHIDEHRSLGPKPTNFAPWDGKSTVLYDTQSGTETNLGPGGPGRFSPDSTKMVWIANPGAPFGVGEAMLFDVTSGVKRDLGPGRLAAFIDGGHVGVANATGNDSESVDLATGAREAISGISYYNTNFDIRTTPDGYELRREIRDQSRFTYDYYLTEPITGRLLLHLAAQHVEPAGPGTLIVSTDPLDARPLANPEAYAPTTTNIFLVDIGSGRSTFLATAHYLFQIPMAANDRYVVWSDDYCGQPQGRSRIFDRQTNRITEVDAALWPTFTPAGLILEGVFGGNALIDPTTLQYRAVIPAGEPSWSADYRYGSIGQVGGHGGVCP